MHAELLTIGSELLNGATVNTNATYLARCLAELGIPCRRQTTVPDERLPLLGVLQHALSRTPLLILTGGLGPTFDDVTMEVLAETTHRPLAYVPSVGSQIRRFYTKRHRRLQQAALRQAYLPEGGIALPNPIGTAPGLWLKLPGCLVIALPGVPGEMRAIMEQEVVPRMKQLNVGRALEGLTLRTVGLVELSIEAMLKRLKIPSTVQLGLYPHLRTVDIRLTATASSRSAARRAIQMVERPLRRVLGTAIYGTDHQTLEQVVGAWLVKRRKTLALAESCTGGLLSSQITDVPGSSRYLRGSFVAYHNDLKRNQLGVPERLLARYGAVSEQTAKAMAWGAREAAEADLGLSITGIAGPTGGTPSKPVGLVYLGLSSREKTRAMRYQFFGNREAIKLQAAQSALDLLRRYLLEERR